MIEFKEARFDARVKDFKKFLVNELKFVQEELNFVNIEKYKLWKVEYRKYIEVTFASDLHNIDVSCYEMDKLEHEFHFNLYKGSPSDYNNTKSIMRSLILF